MTKVKLGELKVEKSQIVFCDPVWSGPDRTSPSHFNVSIKGEDGKPAPMFTINRGERGYKEAAKLTVELLGRTPSNWAIE